MAEFKKNRMGASRPFTKSAYPAKELFDAECASCHKRTQVPFRPNGKKPVYCSDCFKQNDARGDESYAAPRRPSRDTRGDHTYSYHTDSRARAQRSEPSVSYDRQFKELKDEIRTMSTTLQNLVTAVDTFNRATALTLEIQKHFPQPRTASATAKKAAVKKVAAKPAKAPAKKAAK